VAKRDGEVLFKGSSHQWGPPAGGKTGPDHPFRRKSQKAFERYQKRVAEEAQLTVNILESFGVPVGIDVGLEHELALKELDRFVDENGLDHAGIDVVFDRFERVRYDHSEFNPHEEND
jgi:hypothetical protein